MIALFFCAAMVFSNMPVRVFAEEDVVQLTEIVIEEAVEETTLPQW